MNNKLRCVFILIAFVCICVHAQTDKNKWATVKVRPIKVGIVLPLHNSNGDGKRMTEYYRGILMACDSLKHEGISTDIYAVNVTDKDDIQTFFSDDLKKCDVIFGPLYSQQMESLSKFVKTHDIKLVVPFSINSSEIFSNHNIYQIYEPQNNFNVDVADRFMKQFAGYHPVFIDCNDSASDKGSLTSLMRIQLETYGISYNLTNLNTAEEQFNKAFSRKQPNVVILNTSRMPYISNAIEKLRNYLNKHPEIVLSLYGYQDWLAVTYKHLDDFYALDTYIPTTFYRDPRSVSVGAIEREYRHWFGVNMSPTYPRYALTGYDHAYFFLKGIHAYGAKFTGANSASEKVPLQMPLKFQPLSPGGYQNHALIIVHYNQAKQIEVNTY
jgi:hypothetical protein